MTIRRIVAAAGLAIPLMASGWAQTSGDPGPARPCRPVVLRTLSWDDAQSLIDRQRGKVILVDVWTTTCPVCREHFPEFAQLQHRLRAHGLVCVSLNCDYDGVPGKPPRHYASRVLQFLVENDAHFTNVLLSDPIVDFLETAEIGSTPTYLLYGRDGKLLQRFDGSDEEFTFAEVAQAVESAVSAPRPRGNQRRRN